MSGGGGGGAQQRQDQYSSLSPWAQPYVTSMLGAAQQQVFDTKPTSGTPATPPSYDEYGNVTNPGSPGTGAGSEITGVHPYNAYGTYNEATGGQYGMTPSDMMAARSSVAGFSPLQQQSFQGAQNLQTPGQFGAATQGAAQATLQGLGAGNQLQQMSTNPYAVGAYMNPFIQNALNPALQLSNQNYGMQGVQQQGEATRLGAFGGSREALRSGLNEQNRMLANNQLIGNAYNQAFNNAQQQMNQVANVGLQGAQTGIQGANALGQLGAGQLAAQQGILGLQNQFGTQQQQNQQNVINQGMQNYATALQYPMAQLGQLKSLITGLPVTDVTTQTQAAGPSGASQLAGLGTTGIAGLGLYNAMNKNS